MGLDMYLEKRPRNKTRKQHNAESDKAWAKGIEYWRKNFRDVYNLGYWRKANFLHKFIVDSFAGGVDKCQEIVLTKDNVETILAKCKEALKLLDGKELVPQKKIGESFLESYVTDYDKPKVTINDSLDIGGLEGYYVIDRNLWPMISRILPTQEGFFFGTTNYDMYYIADLHHTIDVMTKVLVDWDEDNIVYYRASW